MHYPLVIAQFNGTDNLVAAISKTPLVMYYTSRFALLISSHAGYTSGYCFPRPPVEGKVCVAQNDPQGLVKAFNYLSEILIVIFFLDCEHERRVLLSESMFGFCTDNCHNKKIAENPTS